MNREKLRIARAEALRFLNKADQLESVLQTQINDRYPSLNPKESGAVRRASMDLTRVLADLRRSK